ncbi:MAG TPA: CNP1-like family protein [Burkholderiales bacterium]
MRAWLALGLILPLAACTQAGSGKPNAGDDVRGGEAQAPLPEYPKPENYLPLQVSATTPFAFFVDAKSVSVGKDGVLRYSLIAKSPDGALNISFEGIRCSDGQFRVYAFGRSDNTWSESRMSRWQPIPADSRNAQRAVLYRDFFCPAGGITATAEEAVRALRRGSQ